MYQNVFDVFGIPVQEIPDNAILSWDGSDWIFIDRPDVLSPIACPDVVDCVQPELDNLWAAVTGKLECDDLASCPIITTIQADILAVPATTLAQVEWTLQTNNDGISTTIHNGFTVEFNGINGLSLDQTVPGVVTVSLPAGVSDGDVMVWDAVNQTVVWKASATNMADLITQSPQIKAMQRQIVSLQEQINSYHP